eukprot:651248-Pyramimonas_sp.AAC.1
MHEAPRILEVQGFCSDFIPTGMGILPGCGQSMPWVKTYLYDLLGQAHASFLPVRVKGYVDDITQTQPGSREEVLAAFVPAAVHLCHEQEAAGA